MSSITISRLDTEAACVPIRRLAVAHALYEQSETTTPADWAGRMHRLIASGDLDLFAAHSPEGACGYATLTSDVATWTGERFGHLDCLFVDASARGAGVGRLLLDAVVSRARERGFTELQWQTPIWNEQAIAFYRRTGAISTTKERFTLDLRE